MNWEDLAALRARGQKPLLPVIVTTWPGPWRPHGRELSDAGVMVITHEPGKPIPVRLLEGLRVVLALEHCGQTAAFLALLKRRGVSVNAHGWCACYRQFITQIAPCEQTHECERMIERLKGGSHAAA